MSTKMMMDEMAGGKVKHKNDMQVANNYLCGTTRAQIINEMFLSFPVALRNWTPSLRDQDDSEVSAGYKCHML